MRRIVVMLSATTLALAACGTKQQDVGAPSATSSASSAATSSARSDAKADLVAAIKKSGGTTSAFAMKVDMAGNGITGNGVADPAHKSYSFHTSVSTGGKTVEMEYLLIGTDMYLKSPMAGTDPTKFSHIDTTKVKSLDKLGLGDLTDPTSVAHADETIVTVERTSPGHYKGTIDATKRPGKAGESAKLLGDAMKAIDFEATVDDQGYLVSMVNHTQAAASVPATTTTVTQTDFGKPVTVAKPPAAKIQEMPEAFYATMK